MSLESDILNILSSVPDLFPISEHNLSHVILWIHTLISKYLDVTHDNIEIILFKYLKKVYHIHPDSGTIRLDIVLKSESTISIKNTTDKQQPVKKAVSDDILSTLNTYYRKIVNKLNYLLNVPQPEQRSKEWFKMRESMITASDGGTALGEDSHHGLYEIIMKKCGLGDKFKDNFFTHHGKKYEQIAILIYEHRNNVQLLNFGLIKHKTINILGASPDSICNILTLTMGLTMLGGRMIEIKCPITRQIKFEGELDGELCPHSYWIQVQLQLECCDLEECDFWQCSIEEYKDKTEFISDTNKKKPGFSKETGMERGAIIQLLPQDEKHISNAHHPEFDSQFIYPKKLHMTAEEIDAWIEHETKTFNKSNESKTMKINGTIWWKLVKSNCSLIKRDRDWFKEKLPILEKTWSYIEFFRKNNKKLELWNKFIETRKIKRNKEIMKVADRLVLDDDGVYVARLERILKDCVVPKKKEQRISRPSIKLDSIIDMLD
jgi:putative phage-type endonuclease